MEDGFSVVAEEQKAVYNIKHRAYIFSKNVVLYIGSIKLDRIYFSIFDQLIRSATSIGANLIEGSAGVSKKDFLNFYSYALKSANETKYWLCLLRDTVKQNDENVKSYIKEADELSKIIGSIIVSAKGI